MTPKEKAIELYYKFYNRIEHTLSEEYSPHEKDVVKQCALIAVDEMMDVYASALNAIGIEKHIAELIQSEYLQQVKQEIEKL